MATWAALLVLALPCACDSSGTQVLPDVHTDANDPTFTQVLAFMQRQMAIPGAEVPGGAIAIVVDGKLELQAGVGVERHGEFTPVSATTLFRVASLSKVVLAATAMRLVENGELDPSAPITTYLPDYALAPPFDAGAISAQQLLDHTSGIPDFSVDIDCPVGPGAAAAWFAASGRTVLWTPPGEVWNYTNQGYAVAGWLVQSAAKMSYEDAVASLVFGPVGMTTATFDPQVAMAEDHADGHVVRPGSVEVVPIDAYDCEVTRPPGGVIASVVDYAHLAEVLLASGMGPAGRVLQPSSVLAMETGHADTEELPDAGEEYGYGLFVEANFQGHRVLHHNGLLDYGYQSSMWLVPDSGFAVVVFYDATGISPDLVSRRAIETFLDGGDASLPDGSTSPGTWQVYAGTYVDEYNLGTIAVDYDDGGLSMSIPKLGIDAASLVQQGGATFSAPIDLSAQTATFYPGPCGSAQWFVTRGGVGIRQPACDAGFDGR